MSEKDVFNALAAGNAIPKYSVVGTVTRAIEPPAYMINLPLRRGFYVEVDMVAVMDPKGELFPMRGTVIAASQTADVIGKTVEVRRKSRNGDMAGPGIRPGDKRDPFRSVNALCFTRGQDGWYIWPNDFVEVDTESGLYKDILQEFARTEVDRVVEGVPKDSVRPREAASLPGGSAGFSPLQTSPVAPGATTHPTGSQAPAQGRTAASQPGAPQGAGGGTYGGTGAGGGTYGGEATTGGDTHKRDLVNGLVNRPSVSPLFEGIDAIEEAVQTSKEARRSFREKGSPEKSEFTTYMRNAVISGFRNRIAVDLSQRVSGVPCREILTKLLPGQKQSKIDSFLIEVDEDAHHLTNQSTGFEDLDDLNSLFLDIVGVLTGTNLLSLTNRVFYSKSAAATSLIHNPYLFSIMINLPILKADSLFFLLAPLSEETWYDKDEFNKYRDYLIVLNEIQDENIESTLVPKSTALHGKELPSGQARAIDTSGLPFTVKDERIVEAVQRAAIALEGRYTGRPGVVSDFSPIMDIYDVNASGQEVAPGPRTTVVGLGRYSYRTLEWLKDGRTLTPSNRHNLLEDMDADGLCTITDTAVIPSNYFEMELFIYKETHALASQHTNVTTEVIQQGIAEYEADHGFQLEDLQKEGIGLVQHRAAILSGQAGSGKTTVSEAMINTLKKVYPNYKIMLAAPTGKAARRMKEVVGHLGEVKTIHSLFKLGIGAPLMFEKPRESEFNNADEAACIYVLDEMAMATTSLAYNIMKGIAPSSLVYFLGDIKQLPPIGKGTPFRDMLNYMPAIELGVSKRAAEGSGINKNCDLINQHSEPGDFEDLVKTDDFLLIPCNDQHTVDTVLAGVRNNAQKMDADDIQVATPYATPKKPHSSSNMNPKLQDIFLPNADAVFTHSDRLFKEGARTIHVKKNNYGKMHYQYDPELRLFTQEPSIGVVNGELGHVKGIVHAEEVDFEFNDAFISECEENGIDVVKDNEFDGPKPRTYYVIVEIDDVDLGRKSLVLYRATGTQGDATEFSGQPLMGGELSNLELSYALTVHKLQGSQAKMIIVPLMSSDNKSFITRNMLYTAVSRAQDQVVVVGSVDGGNSMVNAARRSTTTDKSTSILSVLSGLKDI